MKLNLAFIYKPMLTFSFLVFMVEFIFAQQQQPAFKNNVGINLLALPVANSVIAYEHYFNRQSVWFGFEHHFNGLFKEEDKKLNSYALEYRRYFSEKKSGANGLFAGVYSKYRNGSEISQDDVDISHAYDALFAGLNAGYQTHVKRLVFSVFAGYGIPVLLKEEEIPAGNVAGLNEGYKQDLRLGLTVGFAF